MYWLDVGHKTITRPGNLRSTLSAEFIEAHLKTSSIPELYEIKRVVRGHQGGIWTVNGKNQETLVTTLDPSKNHDYQFFLTWTPQEKVSDWSQKAVAIPLISDHKEALLNLETTYDDLPLLPNWEEDDTVSNTTSTVEKVSAVARKKSAARSQGKKRESDRDETTASNEETQRKTTQLKKHKTTVLEKKEITKKGRTEKKISIVLEKKNAKNQEKKRETGPEDPSTVSNNFQETVITRSKKTKI